MSISLDQQPEPFSVGLYCMSKLRNTQIHWHQGTFQLLLPHIKLFKKRAVELVYLPYCQHDFWKKIFITLYSINWPNFIIWLPLLEILDNICILTICSPVDAVINFESSPNSLTKPFSYIIDKVGKNVNILRTKRAFKMK